MPADPTPEELFAGHPDGLALYEVVARAVAEIGPSDIRATKSQVAFRRRAGFAFVWRPAQYVRSEVPAVLSIALPREIASPRFKEVAHPSATVWMHHLELTSAEQVDAEVRRWLTEAHKHAG